MIKGRELLKRIISILFSFRGEMKLLGSFSFDVQTLNNFNIFLIFFLFGFSYSWINQVTEGKIPEIISDTISPETKLVVTSAIYFKAVWEKTFIDGGTTK